MEVTVEICSQSVHMVMVCWIRYHSWSDSSSIGSRIEQKAIHPLQNDFMTCQLKEKTNRNKIEKKNNVISLYFFFPIPKTVRS